MPKIQKEDGIKKAQIYPFEWVSQEAKVLRKHPQFQSASLWQAKLIISGFKNFNFLSRIVSEEARYLICAALLALYHARDTSDPDSGATLSRLQTFATQFKIAGPNRVSALVALMKYAGYVVQVDGQGDRRFKQLEATEQGLQVAEAITMGTFAPLALLYPDQDYLTKWKEDEYFPGRFYAESLKQYLCGARYVDNIPECKLFTRQNAGREIMFKLWIAKAENPPGDMVVSCLYGKVARELGVSRGHVRSIIEKGERNGLFAIQDKGGRAIEILPAFVELHETMTALEFLLMMHAADAASASMGERAHLWWQDASFPIT